MGIRIKRKLGEQIAMGTNYRIKVVKITRGSVVLDVVVPPEVKVIRLDASIDSEEVPAILEMKVAKSPAP